MTKRCSHCGTEIDDNATRCYNCKEWVYDTPITVNDSKPQDFLPTALLALFLGQFGVHRFFTGSICIGVAQLLTLGGCGVWSLIDIILICFNKFRDAQGRLLANYDKNIGIVLFVIILIPLLLLFLLILGIILAISLPTILK